MTLLSSRTPKDGLTSSPGVRELSGVNPAPGAPLTFHCASCVLDWDEGFCGQCGANLMPKATA